MAEVIVRIEVEVTDVGEGVCGARRDGARECVIAVR